MYDWIIGLGLWALVLVLADIAGSLRQLTTTPKEKVLR